MKNSIRLVDIGTRLLAAGILGFSAFMKLTAAPATIYIFHAKALENVNSGWSSC